MKSYSVRSRRGLLLCARSLRIGVGGRDCVVRSAFDGSGGMGLGSDVLLVGCGVGLRVTGVIARVGAGDVGWVYL